MLILVADDYENLAEVMTEMLMDYLPCEALAALDGAQALALAFSRRPNACILDVDMPKMSRMEVARALRDELGAEAPLLIAVTGKSFDSAQQTSVFDAVLKKPVELDQLLALLEAAGPLQP